MNTRRQSTSQSVNQSNQTSERRSHTVEIDRAHYARHHDHETRLLLIVLAGGEQIVASGRVETPVAVLARAVDALGEGKGGGKEAKERGDTTR